MTLLPLSEAKQRRLRALSTASGIIAALAIDQRKSLRRMLALAADAPLESVSDSRLEEFKNAVTGVLTAETSAVLLDPEYGTAASNSRAKGCGLLLAYEMDGYDNPRPHRMLALMPRLSVRRLRDMGAQGIKILLHYAPHGLASANDEKRALIERIGNECDALDMPFFLEPVVYDPAGLDPRSLEFAQQKPRWVIGMIEEFSKPVYKVDILKVEFPVTTAYVEGCEVYGGERAYSMEEALDWFRAADRAAGRPYIYLSAGVSGPEFLASLRLASRAGSRFSGVLCGRANWQDGAPVYARPGSHFDAAALTDWLRGPGLENIRATNDLLRSATPWQKWFESARV